ncbi:fumarylacetoacetate hydrolase [Tepidimonas charontis]|nr:fumarylacetoacetate hydrolase [Tepidimonas charontis]
MKLATYRDGSRDGQLVVVSRDGTRAHYATGIAETLQHALDDWNFIGPQLRDLAAQLDHGHARHAFAFDPAQCAAPLPRAYGGWVAVAADTVVPWPSDALWGPQRALPPMPGVADVVPAIVAICGDIGAQAEAANALEGVRLLALAALWRWGSGAAGDAPERPWGITLAPCALTPDALGPAWQNGRLHATLSTTCDGRKLGLIDAAEPVLGLGPSIAQAALARGVRAGVWVALGAWSMPRIEGAPTQWPRGFATLAQRRAAECATLGAPSTPWLMPGSRVYIEARLPDGEMPFGSIDVDWPST